MPSCSQACKRPGAAHAAHHFVEDQHHAVAVADGADALEIIRHRRHRARGRADHGFGDKGDDLIGAEFQNLVLQRLRRARGIGRIALAGILQAIGKAGIDMMGFDQQRAELRAPPFIAAGRQRAERIAVIALPPRDDMPALRLALLDKILPRHLQRGLDRFRAAADEIDVIEASRRILDQAIGQLLGDIGREEAGMGIGEPIELLVQRRQHIGMAVAEAGNRGAAGCVDIGFAVAVEQLDALAADG